MSIAISGLIMTQVAQAAAPTWECRTGPHGGWECLKEGQLVLKEPVPSLQVQQPLPGTKVKTTPEITVQEQTFTTTPLEPIEQRETAPVKEETPQPEPPAQQSVPETELVTAPGKTVPVKAVEAIPEESTKSPATGKPKPPPPPAQTMEPAVAPIGDKGAVASRIDQDLNWEQCGPLHNPGALSKGQAPEGQTLISADAAIIKKHENIAQFSGNVGIHHGDEWLEADRVVFDRTKNTLDVEGNIFYKLPGLLMSGNSAHLDMNTDQGYMKEVEYRLPANHARGHAVLAEIETGNLSHNKEISYTTCRPGDDSWMLRAETLDLDRISGTGTARHAKLAFMEIPFLYTPYIIFPIDDRRQSGFLTPSIGYSDEIGLDIRTPYYFNIAPNQDAILTPRTMSHRGLMLEGEFRYLSKRHQGVLNAEFVPHDRRREEGENTTRGAVSFKSHGVPARSWQIDTNINYASDKDYLEEFGDSLSISSTRHLERRGDIRYNGDGWNFLGRIQGYQMVDKNITASSQPYTRLPQLVIDLNMPDRGMGLTYQLHSEYVYFDHDDTVRGHRLDLQPGISLPMSRSWGYLTPKASLRYTAYALTGQAMGSPDNPDRILPTISLDGGLFFERKDNWFSHALTQTLEPRLFYLYTPKEDQSSLPDFDTAMSSFSFAAMFRENRFSGADRVGDANQLTTALTSRLLNDDTGAELLRTSIGQITYFQDREIQLSGTTVSTRDRDNRSTLAGEISVNLSTNWSGQAAIQWNPHISENKTEKSNVQLRYNDTGDRLFNLGYSYQPGSVEQIDLSARFPLNHKLHAVARWNHSWLYDRTMEAFAGLEYEDCCWATRVMVRRFVNDVNAEGNNGIFLQLELKGLTSIGERIDKFLGESILGYTLDK